MVLYVILALLQVNLKRPLNFYYSILLVLSNILHNIRIMRSRLSSTAGRTLNDLGEAEGSYEVATRSVT